jgi:hypothetical protein
VAAPGLQRARALEGSRRVTTLLNYARRYRCGDCGLESERRTMAGVMLATRAGWLCQKCWAGAEIDTSHSAEFEPAPLETTISGGALAGGR